MSIANTLASRFTNGDLHRGWICVSEREWNAYFRSFGVKHLLFHEALGGGTLLFRGCQLRVL